MSKLSFSLEDYIEEIYNQILKTGSAKVTDISNALNVKKSSVSGALSALSEKKLVNYAPYSSITLTKEGEKIAKEIVKKHNAISEFFITVLAIPEEEALDTACKMEHIISKKMLKNMQSLSKCMKDFPEFAEKIKQLAGS